MGPIEQLRSGESERQSWLQSRGQVSIKATERKEGLFYGRKREKHRHEHLQMPGKRAVKQHSPEVLPVCLRVLMIIFHFSYILYLKCNMSGRRTLRHQG